MEDFQTGKLLADTDKLDWRPGDLAHRKCRAAARVAIELGQDDAGERQRVAKCSRGIHRVLTLHCIDDEKRLDRRHGGMQCCNLLHHRVIDRKPARGVDQHHFVIVAASPIERRARNRNGRIARRRRKEIDIDLGRERPELFDRSRPINVAAHQQSFLAHVGTEQSRQLARGRCLAGALQSRQQDHRRRRHRETERRRAAAHERRELALDDADQRLARRERADDLLANGLLAHRGYEIPDHGQRYIGFEQRHAHFAQSVLDIGVGQPRFAAQLLHDTAEPCGQIVKHRGVKSACGSDMSALV